MRMKLIIVTLLLLMAMGCDKKTEIPVNKPETETKHTVEVFGTIKALDEKNIMIDFPAAVEAVHVREGQRVKAGTPLVTLNISELDAAIRKKAAELCVARLELDKNNYDAELKKLANELRYQEELYKKAEILYAAGALPQYQLEEDYYNSIAGRREHVEELKLALNNLENEQESNLKINNEKIAVLELELKTLRDKLNKSYLINNDITADIANALVCDIGYGPGDVVNNEKKLLSIINLDSIFVQADVAEEFIKDIRLDAPVTIVPVADKSRAYSGRVVRIADKAQQINGETTIAVDIAIEKPDDFLRPDFNVDVSIDME